MRGTFSIRYSRRGVVPTAARPGESEDDQLFEVTDDDCSNYGALLQLSTAGPPTKEPGRVAQGRLHAGLLLFS